MDQSEFDALVAMKDCSQTVEKKNNKRRKKDFVDFRGDLYRTRLIMRSSFILQTLLSTWDYHIVFKADIKRHF